jgi:hypothetical protein
MTVSVAHTYWISGSAGASIGSHPAGLGIVLQGDCRREECGCCGKCMCSKAAMLMILESAGNAAGRWPGLWLVLACQLLRGSRA